MSLKDRVVADFRSRYGEAPPLVVRAPGRVNLIGEHTDYNDGFVLPMAIDRAVWIAFRRRDDHLVRVHSLEFGQASDFSLHHLHREAKGWVEYVKGMAWALQDDGAELGGWEGVVASDIPVGAGLSSSAALELATARAFAVVSNLTWDAVRMAKLGQRAENEWVGMNCGIMDQMISSAGQSGRALLIDCRSLHIHAVPLAPETSVVVLDSGKRRGLVDSAYNERRSQCEAAARFFGVEALRDVTSERLKAEGSALDDLTYRRARHVVTENERTLQAAEALRQCASAAMGRLMVASHVSMRDDFEISCVELDAMVSCALGQKSCFGARMTGGGFGGCAVALVRAEATEEFAAQVVSCYSAATGLTPAAYFCQASSGAEVIWEVV